MSYTFFGEVAEGRSVEQDQKFTKTGTRVFLVRVSSGNGPIYAASHASLPSIGDAHPEDANLLVNKISCSQDQGDPLTFRVTLSYGYYLDQPATGDPAVDVQQQGLDPADREESPLLRPRDYTISSTTRPEAIQKAWSLGGGTYSVPIVNSAGDPLLPPPERLRAGIQIVVGINDAAPPDSTWWTALDNAPINSSSLTVGPYTFSAGQVRLSGIQASPVYERGTAYWRWTLTWEARQHWYYEPLDQGRREKPVAPSTVPRLIIDEASGAVVSSPVPLDGAGNKLASGGTPQYLTFHTMGRTAFAGPI